MDQTTLVFTLLLAAAGLVLFARRIYTIPSVNPELVHLRSLPDPSDDHFLIGQTRNLMVKCPWDLMRSFVVQNNYRVTQFRLVTTQALLGSWGMKPAESLALLSTPHQMNIVLNRRFADYRKEIDIAYRSFLDILGNGLVTSEGSHWKRQRTLLGHPLRVGILDDTIRVSVKAADRISARFHESATRGLEVNLMDEFKILTLEVIAELFMDLAPEVTREVLPKLYLPIVEEANLRVWYPLRKYHPTASNMRYQQTLKQLNVYITTYIEKSWEAHLKNNRSNKDAGIGDGLAPSQNTMMLHKLFSSIPEGEWGPGWIHQLRDELKTFLLAGHETSATMLTFCFYELIKSPEKAAKVIQEAQHTYQQQRLAGEAAYEWTSLPTLEEIRKMAYTHACLKESLRRYTPVPVVARQAVCDTEIEGVFIPKKTKVLLNIKAVHMNPEIYADPEVFVPERFLQNDETDLTTASGLAGYEFLPFINGPRNCLGQHLALLESQILTSVILSRFSFTFSRDNTAITDPTAIASLARQHTFIVPIVPETPLTVKIAAR